MSARPIKFKSSLWLKWTLLLTLWILSFLILVIVARNNELNTFYNNALNSGPELRLPKNQTGAVRYTRLDPKENGRPIYSVYFNNLCAENSKLGIFKTALHKVVKIQDLSLRFYQYTSPKVSSTGTLDNSRSLNTAADGSRKPGNAIITDVFSFAEDTATDAKTLIRTVGRLLHPKDGWRVNIDLSNVSEVYVNNFDYEVSRDGDLFFCVQSKRAIASTRQSGLILRGHVTIKIEDGSTLESNWAKWDIKNQHFTVNGIYVLNRNGVKTIGKGICVDAQLNVLREQHAKSEGKERKKCLARL